MSTARPRRKAEACAYENCGSRRFHVGEDGYTYCERGHQQSERGTVIAEDTGEFIQLGRKTRRVDSDAESAVSQSRSFSGTQALEHYLLCLQLVLRKQLRWLIDVQEFPAEIETLVRDLFALRLESLRATLPSDPTASDPASSAPASSAPLFSSQSESEPASASASATSRRSKRQRHPLPTRAGAPPLIETLTLLYTGALLLRLPLTIADLLTWANAGELPYLLAARAVPMGMLERLPGRYQGMLEPQEVVRGGVLHGAVLGGLGRLGREFGMVVPGVNVGLVVGRWVRTLGVPVEVFAGVGRLGRLLGMGFGWEVGGGEAGGGGVVVMRWPEVRLMAVLVVVVKLLFPFDDEKRFAERETDLSATKMNWDAWVREPKTSHREETAKQPPLSFADAFTLTPADLPAASDATLDAYLDWYEANVASEAIRERGRPGHDANFRRALFDLFPTQHQYPTPTSTQPPTGHPTPHPAPASLAQQTAASLTPLPLRPPPAPTPPAAAKASPPAVPRPGAFYRRFRHASELSGAAEVFFERAARLAGTDVEELVAAVFAVERRVQKFEEGERRRGTGGEV